MNLCTPECTEPCAPVCEVTDIVQATHEFMTIADQLAPEGTPSALLDMETRLFRLGLLAGPKGEVNEYIDAERDDDPVEILDGLADSIVVELGTMFRYFGLKVTLAALGIVADANLAKVTGPDGVLKDDTGKVIKPEHWERDHNPTPKLRALLEANGWKIDGQAAAA